MVRELQLRIMKLLLLLLQNFKKEEEKVEDSNFLIEDEHHPFYTLNACWGVEMSSKEIFELNDDLIL